MEDTSYTKRNSRGYVSHRLCIMDQLPATRSTNQQITRRKNSAIISATQICQYRYKPDEQNVYRENYNNNNNNVIYKRKKIKKKDKK